MWADGSDVDDGGVALVRQRRVVEEDAHLAVVAARVAEGVLDRRDVAGGGAREVVRAHGHADAALELDLVVVVHALGPALAAVDREASVLALELVVLHRLGADKVRHGLLTRRAERVGGRLGRLEQHVAVAVAIELASGLASLAIGKLFDKVALDLVDAVVRRARQQLETVR